MGNRKMIYDAEAVVRLWKEGVCQHDICMQLGIAPGSFWEIKRRLSLPPRDSDRARRTKFSEPVLPTPEEIASMAAAFRDGWSEEERRKRAPWACPPVAYH